MAGKTKRFSKNLHVLLTDEQHNFMEASGSQISTAIRGLIDKWIAVGKGELEETRRKLAEVEPLYLSLKKRVSELETEARRLEDERRTKEALIEKAHQALLGMLKDAHNRIEDVPKPPIRFWADKCGESVDTLRDWLKEQAKQKEEEGRIYIKDK